MYRCTSNWYIPVRRRQGSVDVSQYVAGLTYHDLQVVTERTPWRGGYVGISSFGDGGSNVHVLLRSPDDIDTASSRPAHVAATATRLVTCAGRTKTGVEAVLAEVSRHPTNVEQYLVQSSVSDLPPSTHPYRATALLNSTDSRQTVEVHKRPVGHTVATGTIKVGSTHSCFPAVTRDFPIFAILYCKGQSPGRTRNWSTLKLCESHWRQSF